LNKALIKHGGTLIFSSHDQEFTRSIADRVIEITPDEVIDHQVSYDEFLRRRTEAFERSLVEPDAPEPTEPELIESVG
jgi:ATPase subunit of ABC transporter with duplicated ATPase domains